MMETAEWAAPRKQCIEFKQQMTLVRSAEEAVRFADESPEPAPDELWTDVYVGVARESHHDG